MESLCLKVPEIFAAASPSGGSGTIVAVISMAAGTQLTLWAAAEALTRWSQALKNSNDIDWKSLAGIAWRVGVWLGKLGWGTPKLVIRHQVELVLKAKKKRAGVDRPVGEEDVGRYVRYKGVDSGIGRLLTFDRALDRARVRNIVTDRKEMVTLSKLTFLSDED